MVDNNNLKNVLNQLNNWCSVNYPQVASAFDECAGYNLQQLVYYLFGVVRDNTSLTNDATDQFNELYTFVHDYFDNLDVQTEINNKLGQMAQDGTLSQLITPIISNEQVPIFVNETSEMLENNKIYVLISTGHIWQYNGESFEDTGYTYGIPNQELSYNGITTDLNNALSGGYYYTASNANNSPVDGAFTVMCLPVQNNNYVYQLLFTTSSVFVRLFKISGSLGDWKEMSYNYCGSNVDINSTTNSGFYVYTNGTTPSGNAGLLLVFNIS